jgi:hypothetical protein
LLDILSSMSFSLSLRRRVQSFSQCVWLPQRRQGYSLEGFLPERAVMA